MSQQQTSNREATCDSETVKTYQDELAHKRDQVNRCEIRWSWLRLLSFVGGVVCVVLVVGKPLLALAVAVGAVSLFLGTVYRHGSWLRQRTLLDWQIEVVRESRQALAAEGLPLRSGQRPASATQVTQALPALFDENMTWTLTEQEQDDLDLYGAPVGIFGLLNRTSTTMGARRLRDILEHPYLDGPSIQARQHAIGWLAQEDACRHRLMATAWPLRRYSADLDALAVLLQDRLPSFSHAWSWVLRGWSLVSVTLVVLGIVQFLLGQPWGRILLTGVMFVNGLLWLVLKNKSQVWRTAVLPYTERVRAFRCLPIHFAGMAEDLPASGRLGLLKETAQVTLKHTKLVPLCDWLEWARIGGLVRVLLNLVAFYDIHMAQGIINRLSPGQASLSRTLAVLAELEAYTSLACFSAQLPVFCMPELDNQVPLRIEAGCHPLLFPGDNQSNSIGLDSQIRTWVITGPNAAGKSTFLRMVGVNVLLAQIGSAVSARAMQWSPVRLMTDVRVRDDLAKHESYFLSEVRRLRRIVMDQQASPPIFALIDEPFRGTNSLERTAAGVALLEHLIETPHFVLIATHEATLAESAAQAAQADNYHFQEQLAAEGVMFDYCLRPGPTTAKTALRLLAKEGYPDSLLKRARDWVQNQGD